MEKQEEGNQITMQSPEHFRFYGGTVEGGIYSAVLCEPLRTMLDAN